MSGSCFILTDLKKTKHLYYTDMYNCLRTDVAGRSELYSAADNGSTAGSFSSCVGTTKTTESCMCYFTLLFFL